MISQRVRAAIAQQQVEKVTRRAARLRLGRGILLYSQQGKLGTVGASELAEQIAHMCTHRCDPDRERFGNFGIGLTLGNELEHIRRAFVHDKVHPRRLASTEHPSLPRQARVR